VTEVHDFAWPELVHWRPLKKKSIVERLGELLQSNAFSIAKDLLKADTVDLGEHVVSLAIERRIQGFVRCAA